MENQTTEYARTDIRNPITQGFASEQDEIDDIAGDLIDQHEIADDMGLSEKEWEKWSNDYYAKRMREIKRKWHNIS